MRIKNIDNKILLDKVRWGFFNKAVELGKITDAKKCEILDALKNPSLNIHKKNDIRNSLVCSGILSENEFDGLYDGYVNFERKAFFEIKKFLSDIHIFPDGYEFLVNDLTLWLVRDGAEIKSLKRDLDITEGIEDVNHETNNNRYEETKTIKDLKKRISDNIEIFEKMYGGGNKHILGKLIFILTNNETATLKEILDFFNNELGIKNIEDIAKLQDLLDDRYIEKLKIFIDAGIKNVDDLLKLKDLITVYDYYVENIKFFVDKGIYSVADLVKLKDLIEIYHLNFEVLNFFMDNLDIKNVDDLLKLKDFCFTYDVIIKNIKFFLIFE